METNQTVKNEARQTVRYASFREAYLSLKSRSDLDQTDPFYNVLLEVLEEDAAKEAQGVKVDAGTVFSEAVSRIEMRANREGIAA